MNPGGTNGGFLSGNFGSPGGDEELLLIGSKQGTIFSADGSQRKAGIHGQGFMMYCVAWDYDGDGIAEVVPSASLHAISSIPRSQLMQATPASPSDTPVFDLAGKLVARLPQTTTAAALVADFDGDGQEDILFPDALVLAGASLPFYGQMGRGAGSISVGRGGIISISADLDGDGASELVRSEARPQQLTAYSYSAAPRKLAHPINMATNGPASAGRLSGGPGDDLFFANGYLSSSSDSFIQFQASSSVDESYHHWAVPVVADLAALGGKVVALPGGIIGSDPVAHHRLGCYDANGQAAHEERFSRMVMGLAVIHSGGKDYLAVQLEDRILIHP